MPDKSTFSILPGGWKEKFDKLLSVSNSESRKEIAKWQWTLKTGLLTSPNKALQLEIKPSSLEGRLIRILCQEKASKTLLIETLWPSQSETSLMDNRLHRMISRLNKKLGELIDFDGKYYRLKAEVTVE